MTCLTSFQCSHYYSLLAYFKNLSIFPNLEQVPLALTSKLKGQRRRHSLGLVSCLVINQGSQWLRWQVTLIWPGKCQWRPRGDKQRWLQRRMWWILSGLLWTAISQKFCELQFQNHWLKWLWNTIHFTYESLYNNKFARHKVAIRIFGSCAAKDLIHLFPWKCI